MVHVGFDKGFLNYRKSIEQQFSNRLIQELSAYYAEEKSWNDFYDNKRLWRDLIVQSAARFSDYSHEIPPPHERRENRRMPPAGDKKRKKSNDFRKRDRPTPPIRNQMSSLSLFDKNKSFVVGLKIKKNEDIHYKKITNDKLVVGYLGLLKLKSTRSKQDELFVKNINGMLIKIGLLMIVAAIFLTFPIANYFTKLINKITLATKKIAAGDYSVRVLDNRHDELGTLVRNFNLLAQTLQSNASSQRKIITDVAHELRTPIAVMAAQIEAIQDGIHKADKGTMELLHRQIVALTNLINDLHDLSESDLGSLKYQMSEFDIHELINHSFEGFKLKFLEKNINLSLFSNTQSCLFFGDISRINQLISNILNNSFQYTDEGGNTQINFECQKHEVVIKVSDSSPGLTTPQLLKIFERWYRTEKSRNKERGGSGLGLAICKEIVIAHNGEIFACQSELGGISIVIKLPRKN